MSYWKPPTDAEILAAVLCLVSACVCFYFGSRWI